MVERCSNHVNEYELYRSLTCIIRNRMNFSLGITNWGSTMKVLALDGMGVIYQARDDVAELLVPFISKLGKVDISHMEKVYYQCSLGKFNSSIF